MFPLTNPGFEKGLVDDTEYLKGYSRFEVEYISDVFQEIYDDLEARADTDFTDPEDPDEYLASGAFWVPKDARWKKLQDNARLPAIGTIIDEAMVEIEKANPQQFRSEYV